ncbi:hypothetical protein [Butyrivibrio sp. AE3004]|uniref:hypothetical protein n=1 Tax=Butyrivibrio sp. AE3004 TaxID=1506994 RepID=UPI000A6B6891|nr:hypothetical protein [Butyrivibrio sp. AE3004]
MENVDSIISFVINLIIFVLTLILTIRFFREDGKWSPSRGKKAFRYFTTLSNVLCALTSLCMCFYPNAMCAYYLKIIGTAGVTVTMLTVFLFLGRIYGYAVLLKGSDLFMHLITPLLALISLCAFEKRGISFVASFIGMIPVALYAPLYLYNVVLAPKEKRWEDFYAFNRDGKWWISYLMMLVGTAVVCVGFYFLLNL